MYHSSGWICDTSLSADEAYGKATFKSGRSDDIAAHPG